MLLSADFRRHSATVGDPAPDGRAEGLRRPGRYVRRAPVPVGARADLARSVPAHARPPQLVGQSLQPARSRHGADHRHAPVAQDLLLDVTAAQHSDHVQRGHLQSPTSLHDRDHVSADSVREEFGETIQETSRRHVRVVGQTTSSG